MTQHNNHLSLPQGRAPRQAALAITAGLLLWSPFTNAQTDSYVYKEDHDSIDHVIQSGTTSQYIDIDTGVTINGGDTFGISAIVLGSGRQDIVNDGTILAGKNPGKMGDVGIYSETSSGAMEIFNGASGSINTEGAQALYAKSQSGNIALINLGQMKGTTLNQPWYAGKGVVNLESATGGISFTNHGDVKAFALQAGDSAVLADTAGTVDILNEGNITIQQFYDDQNPGAQYGNGNGIRVSSSVSGGTVTNAGSIIGAMTAIRVDGKTDVLNSGSLIGGQSGAIGIHASSTASGITITNTGTIDADTAMLIEGNDIRVQLQNASGKVADITGDILLAGSNNTLAIAAHGQLVDGNVTIGQNNILELAMAGITPGNDPLLSVTGTVNIDGTHLFLDFSGAQIEVGAYYKLMEGVNGIDGWLQSINGVSVGSSYDPNAIYTINGYEVQLNMNNNVLGMHVTGMVPEPTTVALLLSATGFCATLLVRRARARKA